MHNDCTRRQWLAAAAGAALARPFAPAASAAASSMGPTPRVAIAKCPTYGAELLPAMQRMFDQLGGLERLVKGKTVAIKINMTGDTSYRLGHTPAEDTHYTHPRVIAATVHLMGRAGARRVRLLESCWSSSGPLEEFMLQVNWEPRDLASACETGIQEKDNRMGSVDAARQITAGGNPCDLYAPADYLDIDLFLKPAGYAGFNIVFAKGKMVLLYSTTSVTEKKLPQIGRASCRER